MGTLTVVKLLRAHFPIRQ